MFPLNSRVSVRAYGGIRAQITDSVAHLLSESTVFKTKVACGHVQWYDNSMKWETHFRGETLSSHEAFMCNVWCSNTEDVKGKSTGKSKRSAVCSTERSMRERRNYIKYSRGKLMISMRTEGKGEMIVEKNSIAATGNKSCGSRRQAGGEKSI